MPIYIDPTESRTNTRLPDNVASQSKVLPGLEALTGADLLITLETVKGVLPKLDLAMSIIALDPEYHTVPDIATLSNCAIPHVAAVLSFCNAVGGGILVQRKTGRDLSSSIPRLGDILQCMQVWTDRPWLLFVGDLKADRHGEAVIDGRPVGYSYNAAQGAIASWQESGGFYAQVCRDSLLAPWCSLQLDRLRTKGDVKYADDCERYLRPIIGSANNNSRKIAVLAALPGIGVDGAKKLLEFYDWDLVAVFKSITDPDIVKSNNKPKGILGAKTVAACRSLMGLGEGSVFAVYTTTKGEQ